MYSFGSGAMPRMLSLAPLFGTGIVTVASVSEMQSTRSFSLAPVYDAFVDVLNPYAVPDELAGLKIVAQIAIDRPRVG